MIQMKSIDEFEKLELETEEELSNGKGDDEDE